MRIDYKLQDKFDFGIFIPCLLLFGIGLAAIYSSTVHHPTASGNFDRQLVWGMAAFIVFFITYSIPISSFRMMAVPLYLLSLGLLMAVLVMGRQISGAKSWLDLGSVGFQPSEMAKIGTILVIASFLSRNNTNIESFKDIVFTLVIGLVPVGLILLEPDMGTALVFIGIIITMIFWKGISLFGLFIVLSPGFVALSSLFGVYYFIASLVIISVALFVFKKIYSSAVLFLRSISGQDFLPIMCITF